jgi:outer membrane biosynthesis protein TonB
MQVLRAKVVKLCEALGFSTASKWNKMRMTSKLKEIAGLGDVGDDLEEQEDRDLLNLIVTQKGDVDVVQSLEQDPDAETQEEAVEAPAKEEDVQEAEEPVEKPVKAKAKAVKVEEATEEETENVPVKQPKAKKDKVQKVKRAKSAGPGVIASIIEFLSTGSAKSPLSEEDLLAKLVERFPARSADSMTGTVRAQSASRILKDRGLEVKSNDKGRWIEA